MFKLKRAQVIAEYALMISVVVVIMVTMFALVKRSTQKLTQLAADRIGDQRNAEQDFTSNRGYMINTWTSSRLRTVHDSWYIPGAIGDSYYDATFANTLTYSNQGFTKEDGDIVTNSTVDLVAIPLP